jgi:hypothetical protein
MKTVKTYTLVFTELQLDVIYDALNELESMNEDADVQQTISVSEISDIMYNSNSVE